MIRCSVRRAVRSVFDLFLAAMILFPFSGLAQEEPKDSEEAEPVFTAGVEADFNSRYVWHGIAYSDGPVFQPSAWVSAYGLTFSPWANFVLGKEANQGQFNEVDFSLSYEREWKKFTLSAGFLHYSYLNQEDAPATGEIIVTAAYSLPKSFQICTVHSFDVEEYPASYFGEYGLGFEHEFNSKLSTQAHAFLGFGSSKFNQVYLGARQNALNLAAADLGLTYYPLKTLYFRPHLEYTSLLDSNLREQVEDPTIANFGLAMGLEF